MTREIPGLCTHKAKNSPFTDEYVTGLILRNLRGDGATKIAADEDLSISTVRNWIEGKARPMCSIEAAKQYRKDPAGTGEP